MSSLVVTLVGLDRPGLVEAVSDVIRKHDGNWLESRMSHLAGQFAGIVLVHVAESRSHDLIEALKGLSKLGLKVIAEEDATTTVASPGTLWNLNAVGNDRPGIVRELTQVLAGHEVNVEELTTHCTDTPHGGGQIFRASARVRVPPGLSTEILQHELERIAADLMIDFTAVTAEL